MSNQYYITNQKTGLAIDIKQIGNDPPAAGASLQANTMKPDDLNELWTFEPGSSPEWFYIKSARGDLVIDIQANDGPIKDGTSLQVIKQKEGDQNELWTINPVTYTGQPDVDALPQGISYFNIYAKGGWNIDIRQDGGKVEAGAPLQVHSLKHGDPNELWTVTAPKFYHFDPKVKITKAQFSGDQAFEISCIVSFEATGFFPGGGLIVAWNFIDYAGDVSTNLDGPPTYTASFSGDYTGSFPVNSPFQGGVLAGTLSLTVSDSANGLSATTTETIGA